MALIQLVYASQPFGFDTSILSGILLDARRNNTRDNITGALIARHDLFLQLLEGPEDKVEAAFSRIAKDDRHLGVTQLVHRAITKRMFPGWAMRDDPAQSWVWSIDDVANGAISRSSTTEVLGFFTRLAEMKIVPPNQA